MSDDIKVGDRFEIVARVTSRSNSGEGWIAEIEGSRGNLYWTDADLLSGRRLPRAIKVGDRVKGLVSSFSGRGVVLAVDGDEAWVKWSDGTRSTASLRHLILIPGDET